MLYINEDGTIRLTRGDQDKRHLSINADGTLNGLPSSLTALDLLVVIGA